MEDGYHPDASDNDSHNFLDVATKEATPKEVNVFKFDESEVVLVEQVEGKHWVATRWEVDR